MNRRIIKMYSVEVNKKTSVRVLESDRFAYVYGRGGLHEYKGVVGVGGSRKRLPW